MLCWLAPNLKFKKGAIMKRLKTGAENTILKIKKIICPLLDLLTRVIIFWRFVAE